ncbi:hypothetical protein GMF56_24125 [Salmonella enterica]|nr:hypothetical protein [Salmonella enterica]
MLQLKHGVFHPQLHGVLQVKKLLVAVQTALLQAVVFGWFIQPLLVITAGLRLAIPRKTKMHR